MGGRGGYFNCRTGLEPEAIILTTYVKHLLKLIKEKILSEV